VTSFVALNFKADLRPLQRAFINLHAKQAPFAISLALNALAKGVAGEERALIDETFDTPTPFTENAYRIEVATKSKPIAIVAAKDIQAAYLAPYVVGGDRSLGTKRGMLAPRGVALNKYGNLTKGKLQQLIAKPGVFVGTVHTKAGKTINGVWQRPAPMGAGRRGHRKGAAAPRGGLKLLIQFEDSTPTQKRLPFEKRARDYLNRNAANEMSIAIKRALATARR
jgi:hypothetical protein